MPIPWQIVASSVGALITLVGVFVGAILTSRTQRRHWSRDKQIEACADILAESTKVQLSLRRRWGGGDPVEWVAWNQALGAISLVSKPEIVEAALKIDATFWIQSMRIKRGEITDEVAWGQARDLMETDRLSFINTARIHVMNTNTRLTHAPVARPALTDLIRLDEPTPPTSDFDQGHQDERL